MFKKILTSSFLSVVCLVYSGTANAGGVIRVPFTLAAGTNTAQSYNFGDVGVGQYVYATFTYKNTSSKDLQITGSTTEGAVDIVSTDCGNTLSAQATCNVIVGFSVSETGSNVAVVKFNTDLYQNPDLFSVSATGISPTSVLTVTPTDAQYTFSSEEKTFTATNNRSYPLKIDNVVPSSSYWSVSKNSCAIELQPGASCTVSVKYVTSKTGSFSGTLKFLSQSLPVGLVNLQGSLQYGSPSFSVNSISLPSLKVGNTYYGSLNLSNVGKGVLTVSESYFESNSNALSFEMDECSGKALKFNESCTVKYKVLFTSAGNVQNGIGFKFLNASTSYSTVGLFASAVESNPILSISPTVLDYSVNTVGSIKSLPVTINSIGNAPVSVSDIKITGAGAAAYSILNKSSCIGDLSEGNQCIINIQYTAPLTATTLTSLAALNFTSNSNTATPSVTLTGISSKPLLSIDPATQTITGASGQSYFKDYLVSNKSMSPTTIKAVDLSNTLYTLENSTCSVGKLLQSNDSCIVRLNLKNAQSGSGSATITVKYESVDQIVASINHNIEAAYSIAEVGEISCPDVSESTAGTVTIAATSVYACSLQISNPGTTPLYIPNSSFTRTNDTGNFAVVAGTQSLATGVSGYVVPPNSNIKVLITHNVPATAGTLKADYSFKVYGKVGAESTATLFNRAASAVVVPANFAVGDLVCPGSVYVSQSITCTANIYNKSLTEFSTLQGGPNVLANGNQLAAKFSATTISGAAIGTVATLKPTKDTLPTAYVGITPGFSWSVAAANSCTQGSSATNILPGGKCAVSISFTPSIPGNYVVPVWAVSTANVSNWVKSSADAIFTAKPVVADLVATPFDCVSVYPNVVGTCTTKLTNATPVGITNSFAVPTVAAIGSAAALLETSGATYKVTHTCGTGIASGVSCNLSVTFKGTTPGNFTAKVRLTSNSQTDEVDLNATILTPNITLSSFECPPVFVGTNGTCSATLTNGMTTTLTVGTLLSSTNVGFGAPSISFKTIPAGSSANITVPHSFISVGTFTSDISVPTNYGTLKGTASVTVKALPPAGSDTVSDIICPDVSAGWATAYTIDPSSTLACYSVIKNSTSAPLYIPNTAIVKSADTGGFVAKLSSTFMTGTNTLGYSIPANSSIKIYFGHSVPTTPGSISAGYAIKTYSKVGLEASATIFNRNASATIVPMNVSLEEVVCPNALITQDIKCTATVYNRSLTDQSVFTAGPNVALTGMQLAAKFSGASINGTLVSSKVVAPSSDYLPTALNGLAPSFNWTLTSSPICSGKATSTQIPPGGKCVLSITFKPTIAGTYSVPLAAVSNVNNSKWPTATATFEVKSTTLDLVASPFECTQVYPNTTGTCTTTLTNFTPVGVNNTYPQPSVTLNGAAASIIAKNANGTAKYTTTCPATGIAPGASCKLSISFISSTPGTFTGKAVISSNGQSDEVDLAPVVLVPDISITPFICPSAATGESGTCTASFKNGTTSSITVSSVSKTGDTNFGVPVMLAKTVPAGQSSPITLPYKFMTAGTFNALVTANTPYGAVSSPASVTTMDYPAAAGSLSPFVCPTLYYGQVGVCSATLTNLSAQRALTVGAASLPANSNNKVFTKIAHNCGTSLAASKTCTVSVDVVAIAGVSGVLTTNAVLTTTPVLTQPVQVEIKPSLFSVTQPAPVKTSVNTEGRVTFVFKNETAVAVPVFSKDLSVSTVAPASASYYLIQNSCNGIKAPQETCNVILGIKSVSAGIYTGKVSLNYGTGVASATASVEFVIPRLEVVPLYPALSENVGIASKSGNWYKVTNISPVSITLTKFTPVAGTLLFMDANNSGNCYVGVVIPAYSSCIFLEGHNVLSQVTTSVKMTGTSSVEATGSLRGVWTPVYTTHGLKVEYMDGTAINGISGTSTVGTIKLTNLTEGPVQGINITQSLSAVSGNFRWIDQGCSAVLGVGASCYQKFEYTFKFKESGAIVFNVYGTFAQLINKVNQGWGTNVIAARLMLDVADATPLASLPDVRYVPGPSLGGYDEIQFKDSILTNTGKVAFTVTNVEFTPANDIYLQYAGDCIGKTLKPKESCPIRTTFRSNKAQINANRAKIVVTVSGGTMFTGFVSLQAPANQTKICTFGEGATFTSEFTGCARNASAINGPAACSPSYNWNSWLDPIFFDGLPVYKDNKIVTPGKALTWKSSGLPVTQVITKVGTVSYGFNVKPVLQIWMGGKWTAMWGGSGSSGTALARSRSNGIYNYGFGSGTTFAVPADVGGGANPLYAPNGSPYTEFISSGTTTGGYAARQAWIEVTPGPYCHQPGSFLANE